MDDLVMWLRAWLDKDERDAPEVHLASCLAVESSGALYAVSPDSCTCGWPKRLLAEVDAKRRILDWLEDDAGFDLPATKTQAMSRDEWNRVFTARTTIKMLALPYADRPGYREEWKP